MDGEFELGIGYDVYSGLQVNLVARWKWRKVLNGGEFLMVVMGMRKGGGEMQNERKI